MFQEQLQKLIINTRERLDVEKRDQQEKDEEALREFFDVEEKMKKKKEQ